MSFDLETWSLPNSARGRRSDSFETHGVLGRYYRHSLDLDERDYSLFDLSLDDIEKIDSTSSGSNQVEIYKKHLENSFKLIERAKEKKITKLTNLTNNTRQKLKMNLISFSKIKNKK